MSHLHLLNRELTIPQNQPLNARQIKNNEGGYVYKTSDTNRLERFIILGSSGGTYYKNQKDLTVENAKFVLELIQASGESVVQTVLDISLAGRAPKQDTGIFVLALCAAYGNEKVRRAAYLEMPKVCRTQTTLFQFLNYIEPHRTHTVAGKNHMTWSAGLRRAVANWYLSKSVEQMAYQMVKYRERRYKRERGGDRIWNARNAFRVSHPILDEDDAARRALIDWEMKRGNNLLIASHDSLKLVQAFDEAWSGNVTQARKIQLASLLTHEMIPDEWKSDPKVWEAMLPTMKIDALTRNLSVMTRNDLLKPRSDATKMVIQKLSNGETFKKERMHPAKFLVALGIYSSGGKGGRSNAEPFIPTREIADALDNAYYLAYPTVQPAGKRNLIAVDCSGSMEWPQNMAGPGLTARNAASALALVQVATEPHVQMFGFSSGESLSRGGSGITEIPAQPGHRIEDVNKMMERISAGGTDCSLPMKIAMEQNWKIDTFQIYTDNETGHGAIHPMKALQKYRDKMGIDAKLVVVAMTPTEFSIADPKDLGSLDVSGFDTNVPILIADHSRGATAPGQSANEIE